MKILLIRCPPVSINDYPPDIGFVYIASCLRKDGHDVFVFDLNAEIYHILDETDKEVMSFVNIHAFREFDKKLFIKYLSFWEEIIRRIVCLQAEIAGFNVWNSNALVSLELARRLKDIMPEIITILGGPECYPLLSGQTFIKEPYIDVVVYGEAEITIKKIIDSICKERKVLPIPGIIANIDGNTMDCGWGDYIINLDELPFLALDIFPLELYIKKEALPISFSRGCIFKCKYCPTGMYPRLRCRSVGNIIQEIEYLIKRYPDKYEFRICDASITNNLKQIQQLCDVILSKGLKILLSGFATPVPGLHYKLLLKMKKSGFNSLCYGVETGSARLLNQVGKGIRKETIERVLKETFESGIDTSIDMLVGIPGESEADFDESMYFLVRNRKYINAVSINECAELPYSYFFSHQDKFKRITVEIKKIRQMKMKKLIDSLNFSDAQKFNYVVE